jgi:hypothetical protein
VPQPTALPRAPNKEGKEVRKKRRKEGKNKEERNGNKAKGKRWMKIIQKKLACRFQCTEHEIVVLNLNTEYLSVPKIAMG